MKPITLFVLKYCGYCRRALQHLEAVKAEHPELARVPLAVIDEAEQRELARQYDYYYVPTFYIGDEKVHEGPISREQVLGILERAFQDQRQD